jgi:hydroxycarboxylate dehydrogenase B
MSDMLLFGHEGLRQAITLVFEAGGADQPTAGAVADMLVEANLSGHDSHGIQMVTYYVDCLANGGLDPRAVPELVLDGGAVLRFDGHRSFGAIAAAMAMKRGIGRAQEHGVALVALGNSHHLGRIGHWAEVCLGAGLVSLHFVNVIGHEPMVAPWGGRQSRLGTNPFCAGIPGTDIHAPFVLDFATSKIAFGKVVVAHDKGEALPQGAMIAADGQATRDPGTMIPDTPGGALLAMGEHKGGGLAMLCELLGGALTGGGVGKPGNHVADTTLNGMFSVLIDPEALGGFAGMTPEIDAVTDWVRSSAPAQGHDAIMLAGEPERAAKATRLVHGVPLAQPAWEAFVAAGARLGVAAEALDEVAPKM